MIKKIAADTLSENTVALHDDILRAQMFEKLEYELIIATLEKGRIARLIAKMNYMLIQSMKEALRHPENSYKCIVHETVVECSKLSQDFVTTKYISFLLMNSVSGELANIFVDKIATEYGNYLMYDLIAEIEREFMIDSAVAMTKIGSFIEKFKYELKIQLYKETREFMFSKMKDILSGVKSVPT